MWTSSLGWLIRLVQRHFADVDEPFDPLFQLDEGSVAHHVDDRALDDRADGIFVGSTDSQGLGVLLLQAQGDLFLFAIDVQDHHFDFLVDGHHLRRMADAAPAHVGDVQQAVDAAQVDERAELGDVLDHALADLARLRAC